MKRFSIECYGKSNTIENIRAEKAKKFQELKNHKYTEEYERWFLKYNPSEKKNQFPRYTKRRRYKKRSTIINKIFSRNRSNRRKRKKDIWLI